MEGVRDSTEVQQQLIAMMLKGKIYHTYERDWKLFLCGLHVIVDQPIIMKND